MQKDVIEESLGDVKEKLRSYKAEDIVFSQHAQSQIRLRQGTKQEVISNILSPAKLIYSFKEKEDSKHTLHFQISNTRTMILPVIMNKSLYIITYIMRHRGIWRKML